MIRFSFSILGNDYDFLSVNDYDLISGNDYDYVLIYITANVYIFVLIFNWCFWFPNNLRYFKSHICQSSFTHLTMTMIDRMNIINVNLLHFLS